MAADREALSRTLSEAVSRAVTDAVNAVFLPNTPRIDLPAQSQNQGRSSETTSSAPVAAASSQTSQQNDVRLPSAFSRLANNRIPPKKRRSTNTKQKIVNKNIFCLLKTEDPRKAVPIPRGESRARLIEAGLTGKIAINSIWVESEVRREISNLFASAFGLVDGEILPFQYLSTVPGGKKLCISKTSSSFKWNATEVISTAAQGSLYIMAEIPPLNLPAIEKENSSDDESDGAQPDLQRGVTFSGLQVAATTPPELQTHVAPRHNLENSAMSSPNSPLTSYNSYVSLVDEDDYAVIVSSDEEETMQAQGPDQPVTLQEILKQLKSDNVDEFSRRRSLINVRRKHVWEDACRHLSRKKFDPTAVISVKFADDDGNSEGAVDAGGPRREFLRLLVKAANEQSGLFYGKVDQRLLFPNAAARAKGHYRLVGMILGWSLVHGGPGGNFLSKSLFNAIAFGIGTKDADIEDLHGNELENINKVRLANTVDELNQYLQEKYLEGILQAQGHPLQASSIDDRSKFLNAILNYVLVDSTRYLLDELLDGLKVMGVLDTIRKHPEQFRNVLCRNDTPLDAVMVDHLFEIHLAEEGTNARPNQERAVVYWRDFLQDCNDEESAITLADVLVFATGASQPPPLGFDSKPALEFSIGVFPTANTCGVTLYIPVLYSEYQTFKEAMEFAIQNSPSFGYA